MSGHPSPSKSAIVESQVLVSWAMPAEAASSTAIGVPAAPSPGAAMAPPPGAAVAPVAGTTMARARAMSQDRRRPWFTRVLLRRVVLVERVLLDPPDHRVGDPVGVQ